ncbi:hypothetical protein [Dolichospermum circinale]|uniref:hypothetical protein n=1 Tax=Dolichospermum circinale TaxID=109265 RepID=UPI0023312127|nr:hypothetical protein [Dolichospermum circinale]MDB9451355.1 hypothetical protein [Dolichospermum circinale CS-547]
MLAEKTLDQPIYVEMRLVDQVDKLERLLLSEEEIAALEKLAMSGEFDSEITQRWFANCGGCGGCRFADHGTASNLMGDIDELGFGY